MDIFHEVRQHSVSEIIGMGFSFVWTKIFYPNALLVRRPFYRRGKRNTFVLGKGFISGRGCRFETYGDGEIVFGKNCHIGDYVRITCSNLVKIGDNCLFASKILITDSSHGNYSGKPATSPEIPPNDRPLVYASTVIGNDVWLGENIVVMGGANIGDGCVIGANSTVTRSIPDFCIAVGSPAKPIKRYDFDLEEWVKI